MNRHTQIRQSYWHAFGNSVETAPRFFDGLPAFIDAQELPAVAVWLE